MTSTPDDADRPALAVTVPGEPGPARAILPALRTLVDSQTPAFHAASAAVGKPVTCKRGCAACCRQIIAVSDVEAHALARLVEAMPAPRRARVEARFADAERRMLEWRPLDRLMPLEPLSDDDFRLRAREHYRLGLACPFLEDESCSIYADRPMVCREYDVVSPPSVCGRLAEGERPVGIVRPPVGEALELLTSTDDPPRRVAMPLTFALRWAVEHPEAGGDHLPADWLRRLAALSVKLGKLFERLSRKITVRKCLANGFQIISNKVKV